MSEPHNKSPENSSTPVDWAEAVQQDEKVQIFYGQAAENVAATDPGAAEGIRHLATLNADDFKTTYLGGYAETAKSMAQAIHFSSEDTTRGRVLEYYSPYIVRRVHALLGTTEERGAIPDFLPNDFPAEVTTPSSLGFHVVERYQGGSPGSLAIGFAMGVPMSMGGRPDAYELVIQQDHPPTADS
jgi:hypothetical protein